MKSNFWMSVWLKRGLIACLLFPFSLLFRLIVAIRKGLYRVGFLNSFKADVPVLVVGNIFLGGTGKTPFVIWLVGILKKAGFYPGVVSRGYHSKSGTTLEVTSHTSPNESGDEPLLIFHQAKCPVFIGRKRSEAVKALLKAYPQVNIVLTDDGLQHYALARDIEIVLFDGRGAGNGWLLPAGPLREAVSRKRDFTVINQTSSFEEVPFVGSSENIFMQLVGNTAEKLANRSEKKELSQFKEQRIAASAGIGNPARFFSMLKSHQLTVSEYPLPDHYDFSENPFQKMTETVILITEKDAVKCQYHPTILADERIWVVPIKAQLPDTFENLIVEKCRGCRTS